MNRSALLLASLLLAAPLAAHAQGDADARFQEGVALVKKGDYEGARQKFADAYAKEPTLKTLLNLGLAENKAGRKLEALSHLRKYIRDPKADAQRVAALEKEVLPALLRETGHLKLDAPKAAVLKIDGRTVENSPDELDVEPGKHHVEARDGDRVASADADALAGQTVTVRLDFAGSSTPPFVGTSTPAPVTTTSAPPGGSAEPGSEPPKADAADGPGAARIVAVAALGVGALASFGVAFAFHGASTSAEDRVNGYRAQYGDSACGGAATAAPCADWRDSKNRAQSDATLSTVFIVTGAVLGVAAIATFILWPNSQSKKSVWISPALKGASAGISF